MTDTKDLPGFTLRLGPLVITWRSLFTAHVKYVPRRVTGTKLPRFERLRTMQETEDPWRAGHGAVIRLWPTRHAIMLGWWGEPQVDASAGDGRALSAVLGQGTGMQATGKPVTQLPGFEPATPEQLAEKVAALLPEQEEDVPDDVAITDLRDQASG